MSEIVMTSHGVKRSKERVGLPKRALERNAEKAFENGLKHSELSGSIKRYVDALYLRYEKAGNIRIYCGKVYIFCGTKLVTVLDLPAKFKKKAENCKSGRDKNKKEA